MAPSLEGLPILSFLKNRYTSQLSRMCISASSSWIIKKEALQITLQFIKLFIFLFSKMRMAQVPSAPHFHVWSWARGCFLSFKWVLSVLFTNQCLFIWSSKLNWKILAACSRSRSYTYIVESSVCMHNFVFNHIHFWCDFQYSWAETFRNRGETTCNM